MNGMQRRTYQPSFVNGLIVWHAFVLVWMACRRNDGLGGLINLPGMPCRQQSRSFIYPPTQQFAVDHRAQGSRAELRPQACFHSPDLAFYARSIWKSAQWT